MRGYSSICRKKGLSVDTVTTCFTRMAFFKVWVAASLMILVVFLLTTSWWIVWYLYEKYLTFFLLFTTIWGHYIKSIKWYHSAKDFSFFVFCMFTEERKIGPERIANAIKSQSFSSDYVYLLYYFHGYYQIANSTIFRKKTL